MLLNTAIIAFYFRKNNQNKTKTLNLQVKKFESNVMYLHHYERY